MRRYRVGLLLASSWLAGCEQGTAGLDAQAPLPDLAAPSDASVPPMPCSNGDATCRRVHVGLPMKFPLQRDPQPDLHQRDDLVRRDPSGRLVLDSDAWPWRPVWIPNTRDKRAAGSVSKLDPERVREVARYLSHTCYSLGNGDTTACNGEFGCCSLDDPQRFGARAAMMREPGHQAVQRGANLPSRTAVADNGDLYVANRATLGQSSVTRIAANLSACVDRNQSATIETSTDRDGDGFIDDDCNGDGQPDDLLSVRGRPCKSGLAQEYYGPDDECVVWTTNVFAPSDQAYAIAFTTARVPAGEVWVGSQGGSFARLDAVSGAITAAVRLPAACTDSAPVWGMAIDAAGIAWVTPNGMGPLCWLSTLEPFERGLVRQPPWGPVDGWGITIDRDQNVWIGGAVSRYTPDRSSGTRDLGLGFWTLIESTVGLGIVTDARSQAEWFAFSCSGGSVLRIPASTIKVGRADQRIKNAGWPTVDVPCRALGLDATQELWAVDSNQSTRIRVGKDGAMTQPIVGGPPLGMTRCPRGDSCDNEGAEPFGDFAWFRPGGSSPYGTGRYRLLVPGCVGPGGAPAATAWWAVSWDADVPEGASLAVRARAARSGDWQDPAWQGAAYTAEDRTSPLDLQTALTPNLVPGGATDVEDGWLELELTFRSEARDATAALRSIDVSYRCP